MNRDILRSFSVVLFWFLVVTVFCGSFLSLCINGQQGYTDGTWASIAAFLVSSALLVALAWDIIL